MTRKEEAAIEVSNALSNLKSFKLVFVLPMESACVKPNYFTVLRLDLEAFEAKNMKMV